MKEKLQNNSSILWKLHITLPDKKGPSVVWNKRHMFEAFQKSSFRDHDCFLVLYLSDYYYKPPEMHLSTVNKKRNVANEKLSGICTLLHCHIPNRYAEIFHAIW